MHVNTVQYQSGVRSNGRARSSLAEAVVALKKVRLTCTEEGEPLTLGDYVDALEEPHHTDVTKAMNAYLTMLRFGKVSEVEHTFDMFKQSMRKAMSVHTILQPACVLDAVMDSIHEEVVGNVVALGRGESYKR